MLDARATTARGTRAPQITRLRTSWPSLFVPIGWAPLGGVAAVVTEALGSYGASNGASAATTMRDRTIAIPIHIITPARVRDSPRNMRIARPIIDRRIMTRDAVATAMDFPQ